MDYIFLDTNIFYNNWFVKNANFNLLFNYIENTNSVLLMSELVCTEINNIRNRELEEVIQTFQNLFNKSQKLILEPIEFNPEDIREFKYDIKDILANRVSNISYFPFENIKQDIVVKRALERIKPFKEDDKGYRDTLIWLSFLHYLKKEEVEGNVFFITNNSNDFLNKEKIDFHDELKTDILKSELRCSIFPHHSLFDFIQKRIDKREHSVNREELINIINNIDDELELESLFFINNIDETSFKEILDKNRLRDFPYVTTLVEHSVELMEGVEDLDLLSYSFIEKEKIYINLMFNLRICILKFTIPTSEYYIYKNQIDRIYFEIESGEHYTTFCSYVRTYLDTSFDINMKDGIISGFNIESIDFK